MCTFESYPDETIAQVIKRYLDTENSQNRSALKLTQFSQMVQELAEIDQELEPAWVQQIMETLELPIAKDGDNEAIFVTDILPTINWILDHKSEILVDLDYNW